MTPIELIEFISSLGGLFGLCLGFSIISFLEVFYWGTIRICRSLAESTDRSKIGSSRIVENLSFWLKSIRMKYWPMCGIGQYFVLVVLTFTKCCLFSVHPARLRAFSCIPSAARERGWGRSLLNKAMKQWLDWFGWLVTHIGFKRCSNIPNLSLERGGQLTLSSIWSTKH